MNIALVTETFFPLCNGVSRTLWYLTRFLTTQGDLVTVLQPRYKTAWDCDNDGTTVPTVTFRSLPLPLYPEIKMPVTTPGHVGHHLQELNPDLVHVATEGLLGWSAVKAARRKGLPLVTSYHTNFSQYAHHYGVPFLAGYVQRYLKSIHSAGSATLVPTPAIAEELVKAGFVNLIPWGRGVDCRCFSPERRDPELRRRLGINEETTLFIYAGRLAKEKNLDTLAGVFSRLQTRLNNVHFAVVGDGPCRHRLKRHCPSNVSFAGHVSDEQMAVYMATADLMIFPSLSETFGNVVLESLASGTPVAAFDVTGPADIIQNGKTGRLVRTQTEASLADAAGALAADRKNLTRVSLSARAYAETHSWEAVNATVRETYQRAVSYR